MLSYSLAVASLYIVSGALGDRYGRWSLFVAGVAGFAIASALAGIAPNTWTLVTARVLQGVTGALLTTNSLALLRSTYAEDSGRAVGQWTAWGGIGDDDRPAARRPPGRVRLVAVDLLHQPARRRRRARDGLRGSRNGASARRGTARAVVGRRRRRDHVRGVDVRPDRGRPIRVRQGVARVRRRRPGAGAVRRGGAPHGDAAPADGAP